MDVLQGVVKMWNVDRGFGFVRVRGRDDVFVHFSRVRGRQGLAVGDRVQFRIAPSLKGEQAVDVEIVDGRRTPAMASDDSEAL